MTKVEQVARAIASSQGQEFPDPVPSHGFSVALWGRYMEMARAAIQAMREPNAVMTAAVLTAEAEMGLFSHENMDWDDAWPVAIDAALSETSEES